MSVNFSGIYPHLAVTHSTEASKGCGECGIGAVINFHGRLYFVTYPGHRPRGGDGRIYSVDSELKLTELPESTGGTHADRFIDKTTGKLLLGANIIDPDGNISSLDVNEFYGRMTGACAHPDSDKGMVFAASMEEGLYEVDLVNHRVNKLRDDINDRLLVGSFDRLSMGFADKRILGDHGKGLYYGQDVLIYSNNGHGGSLTEWDLKGDPQNPQSWKLIEYEKFTEITGPGGIFGPDRADDPIWALGWDKRSVLLEVRTNGKWKRYRLPKSSYTQDADNGWFTEWPRIREVDGVYLMCMHGLLYEFPKYFGKESTFGIRPLSSHLKMIADFDSFDNRIVFACDDASHFSNPTLGQCCSNLWFSTLDDINALSEPTAVGCIFSRDRVTEGQVSDPLFVGGFEQRTLCLTAHGESSYFIIEYNCNGLDDWQVYDSIEVNRGKCSITELQIPQNAQWIRITVDRDLTECTACVYLRQASGTPIDFSLVKGLAGAEKADGVSVGRLVALPGEDMKLGYLTDKGFYEIDENMKFTLSNSVKEADLLLSSDRPLHDPIVRFTGHSVLLIDTDGNRYHLPFVEEQIDSTPRVREIVTERSLMNLYGTVYEYPRPESGGVRRIRPITTHKKAIFDFVSWRGLAVISGTETDAESDHIIRSDDNKASLWLGNVDDLWKFGTPCGKGSPLYNTFLYEGEASDPFLVAWYRNIKLNVSHDSSEDVYIVVEADFAADGTFTEYARMAVPAGQATEFLFPREFSAHWVRLKVSRDCCVTSEFTLS